MGHVEKSSSVKFSISLPQDLFDFVEEEKSRAVYSASVSAVIQEALKRMRDDLTSKGVRGGSSTDPIPSSIVNLQKMINECVEERLQQLQVSANHKIHGGRKKV